MGENIKSILNVTIVYPQGDKSFWNYLCGRVKRIDIHIEKMEVTPDLIGDYESDPEYRSRFQNWINNLWEEKDLLLERMQKIQ